MTRSVQDSGNRNTGTWNHVSQLRELLASRIRDSASGITLVKFTARRSKRDLEIRQQYYIVVLTKGSNGKRERTSNVAPLSTQSLSE